MLPLIGRTRGVDAHAADGIDGRCDRHDGVLSYADGTDSDRRLRRLVYSPANSRVDKMCATGKARQPPSPGIHMHTDPRSTRSSRRRRAIAAVSTLVALAISPACLTAQTYWRVPGAIGGALAGAGVGWAVDIAAWGGRDLGGPSLTMTSVGIGLGAIAGFAGGLSADRHLARGATLTRGSRTALRTSLFLTPVAIGSAIAFALINPSDDCVPYDGPDPNLICTTEQGVASDETVALLALGGGVVIGFLVQHKFAPALWPKTRINVAPTGRGVVISIPLGQ